MELRGSGGLAASPSAVRRSGAVADPHRPRRSPAPRGPGPAAGVLVPSGDLVDDRQQRPRHRGEGAVRYADPSGRGLRGRRVPLPLPGGAPGAGRPGRRRDADHPRAARAARPRPGDRRDPPEGGRSGPGPQRLPREHRVRTERHAARKDRRDVEPQRGRHQRVQRPARRKLLPLRGFADAPSLPRARPLVCPPGGDTGVRRLGAVLQEPFPEQQPPSAAPQWPAHQCLQARLAAGVPGGRRDHAQSTAATGWDVQAV
mmetsp:Transcript_106813/g.329953  ORF Transcript_106813/g.329953 Transcript_106813/m.329953 type:complete len:258 (+) Transcript_106813:761-1534(+)